jgi:hypothetical protein
MKAIISSSTMYESEEEEEEKRDNSLFFDVTDLDNELEDLDIDTSWITEFEKVDRDYSSFYKEDVATIQLQFVYINKNNEVETTKQDTYLLEQVNIISQEEVLDIIHRHSLFHGKQYLILSILKYNIDLEPIDVRDFLLNPTGNSFLSPVNTVHSIPLNKTISMFQDLNNLTILFREADISLAVAKKTKRVTIRVRKTRKKRA